MPQLITRHGILSAIDVLQPIMVVTASGETTSFKEGESVITCTCAQQVLHHRVYYTVYNECEARMSRLTVIGTFNTVALRYGFWFGLVLAS